MRSSFGIVATCVRPHSPSGREQARTIPRAQPCSVSLGLGTAGSGQLDFVPALAVAAGRHYGAVMSAAASLRMGRAMPDTTTKCLARSSHYSTRPNDGSTR